MPSLVLAIEPDPTQAGVLRSIVRDQAQADIVLVESIPDALGRLHDRVPDLILLPALLSPGDEEALKDELRTLSDASHLQTLTTPRFRVEGNGGRRGLFRRKRGGGAGGAEPTTFGQEVIQYLRRGQELRDEAERRRVLAAEMESARASAGPGAIPVDTTGRRGAAARADTPPDSAVDPWRWSPDAAAPAASPLDPDPAHPSAGEPPGRTATRDTEPEALVGAADASAQPMSAARPDPPGVAPGATEPATRPDATTRAVVDAAGSAPASDWIPVSLDDDDTRVAKAIERVRLAVVDDVSSSEPAPDTVVVSGPDADADTRIAEAEARLAAEVERVRREAESSREAEIAQLRAEAEALREEAVQAARERARRRAEAALAAEADRTRVEAEKARQAADEARAAEEALARAEAELERVRAETQQAIDIEIERAREEAERTRESELARVQSEAEALRTSAAREARTTAEREASEAVARVRAEAEQMLAEELARARAEAAEALRVEMSRARIEADEARIAELARVREEAHALAAGAAEQARTAAAEAASSQFEVEVARLGAEAETRIAAEQARAEEARAERVAAEARLAEVTEARVKNDQVRELAAREAKSVAESAARQALETEIARLRAEADAEVRAELEQVRAAAEKQRARERQDLESQMADLRALARQSAAEPDADVAATAEGDPSEIGDDRSRAGRLRGRIIGWLEARLRWAGSAPSGTRDDAPAESAATPVDEPVVEPAPAATASDDASVVVPPTAEPARPPRRTVAVFAATGAAEKGRATRPRPSAAPIVQSVADAVETPGGRHDYYSLWQLKRTATVTHGPTTRPDSTRARQLKRRLVLVGAGLVVPVVLVAWVAHRGIHGTTLVDPPTAAEAAAAAAAMGLPVAPVGTLQVESTPTARVYIDGEDRGETPVTLRDVVPGRHRVVLESPAGTVERTITVREGQTAAVVEAIVPGWVTLFSRVRVDVYVEGRHVGRSDDDNLMLPPGRHQLVLTNERLGLRETREVDILPGEVTRYNLDLPRGRVRIDGPAGGEVFVADASVGRLPLASAVEAPLGMVDVVVRHEGREWQRTVDVTLREPAVVDIDGTER